LAIFLTGRAAAQGSHETAQARALFEEGVSLADHGDWSGAADRFERAYALKATAGIAFNWASALAQTGKLVQASELFQGVLRDPAASPELKQESARKLAALTPRVPRLTLNVDRELAEAGTVRLDGKEWPRAVWDVASPVDPGLHVASCTHEDDELAHAEVTLAEGEQRSLLLSTHAPSDSSDPAQPTKDSPAQRAHRPLYKNWVLWAAVGAAVVGGAVVIAVTTSKGDTHDAPIAQGNTGTGVIRW
jgi:hypothetical protein